MLFKREQLGLGVLLRDVLENFLKEINLKVSKLTVLKMVLDGDPHHVALINWTGNGLQFLDTLPADNIAPQLKHQCTPGHCICVGSCGVVLARFQFVQECQVRHLLFGNSALKVDLELVDRLGLELDGLLFFMVKIPTALQLYPIVHSLARRVLNLNKLGTLLAQVTREINGFGLGQLLRQQLVQLINEQEHLLLLD